MKTNPAVATCVAIVTFPVAFVVFCIAFLEAQALIAPFLPGFGIADIDYGEARVYDGKATVLAIGTFLCFAASLASAGLAARWVMTRNG